MMIDGKLCTPQCLGNTAGWKCDRCLSGFWGNPFSGKCKACDCNEHGALGPNCDPQTGQCLCRDGMECYIY